MAKFVEKIQHISVGHMEELIEDTYYAGGNIIFISVPGTGKTEIIESVSKRLLDENLTKEEREGAYQKLDGSGMSEETLMLHYPDTSRVGVDEDPQVLQKDLTFQLKNVLKWMERNKDSDAKMILFVDEFTSFEQETDQRTLMNVFQSGLMPNGETFDPARCVVILAANPSNQMPGYEDYDGATRNIESAVITRMSTHFVKPDLKAFIEGYATRYDEDGQQMIHPYIVSALQTDPNMFMAQPEDDIRVCNPRTLRKLSEYFYSQTRRGKEWSKMYVCSLISDEAGNSMSQIISNLDRLVGIKELFGTDKDDKLNEKALEKFKELEEFEKYYIISTTLNGSEAQVINFGIKNNVKKLLQLLKEGEVPSETLVSFGVALIRAEKQGVKSKILQQKWMETPETNILGHLVNVRQLTNQIH